MGSSRSGSGMTGGIEEADNAALSTVLVGTLSYGGAGWSNELMLRIEPGRAVMRKLRCPPRSTSMPPAWAVSVA